jgi:DNA polymerase-3 subunit delta
MVICYIGYGPAALRSALEEGGAAWQAVHEFNRVSLDGESLDLATLRTHCDTLPFLGGGKLVMVKGLLAHCLQEAELRRGLLSYLPHVPPECHLLLIERDLDPKQGRDLLAALAKVAKVKQFQPPKGEELLQWIEQRARQHGCGIARGAAQQLAEYVAEDLDALDQEIAKLAAYLNYTGTIAEEHVQALVPQTREASIFEFVDAVAAGRRRQALELLHALPNQEPGYVLAMIARQFRLIMQVKAVQGSARTSQQVAEQLGYSPSRLFLVNRLLTQARRFTPEQLRAIHTHLARTDFAIKQSKMDPATALDLLVIALCSAAGPARAS